MPNAAHKAWIEGRSFVALTRAGFLGPEPPQKLLAMLRAMRDYGSFGAASRVAAIRHGDQIAIADEFGEITFAELDELSNRIAAALRARGLRPGSKVGILCRNHRFPLAVAFAASRAGISAVWLNTAFSPRQAKEVAEREGVQLLVHDAEFEAAVNGIELKHGRLVCGEGESDVESIEEAASGEGTGPPPVPEKPGRIVLLTSGTTGTPKGAPRPEPKSLSLPASLLDRMPMRSREATVIGPPIFHGTGLLISLVSIALGSKLILRRRFDAAGLLDDIEHHGATAACLVPIMLQRLLAQGEAEIARRNLDSLRVIVCAGAQLPGEVATQAMDRFGDVVFNLYGSTEVSIATLATPADLRAAPSTVGKPTFGARVRVLGDAGDQVAAGEVGRIYVGTGMPFEGYTGGGGKDIVDGLLATGDLGHFDREGRLYIDGRDDDMIVSGGENLFPGEVEEILITHPALVDVAVIGVEDEEFGQRLRAFVVLAEGQSATEREVKDFVKANLAAFKVPRDIIFLDELPRNPTGKILKRELSRL